MTEQEIEEQAEWMYKTLQLSSLLPVMDIVDTLRLRGVSVDERGRACLTGRPNHIFATDLSVDAVSILRAVCRKPGATLIPTPEWRKLMGIRLPPGYRGGAVLNEGDYEEPRFVQMSLTVKRQA